VPHVPVQEAATAGEDASGVSSMHGRGAMPVAWGGAAHDPRAKNRLEWRQAEQWSQPCWCWRHVQ